VGVRYEVMRRERGYKGRHMAKGHKQKRREIEI
jgi:hypothetical protein